MEKELGYYTRPYADTLRDEADWLVREGLAEGTVSDEGREIPKPSMKEVFEDRQLILSMADAALPQELQQIFKEYGLTVADEAAVESGYHGIEASRNWNRLSEVFKTMDYVSCKKKLEEHGLTTTPAELDLIKDVIGAATDDKMNADMDLANDLDGAA